MAQDWNVANPIDHTKIGDLPSKIRNVKTLVVSGAARIFNQAAAPSTRYDASAFTADDDGSIWIDTDNNKVYIMTDWDAAAAADKWTSIESVTIATLLAAARTFAEIITFSKSPVFTLGILGNNAYLQARNAAGAANVDMIKVGTNNLPTLPDSSEMASNAAPVEDEAVANKKYVDDQLATKGYYADGSTMFNATLTAAATFQDLDLSAKVGSNVALVHLEVSNDGTGIFVAKPKGYGSATFTQHQLTNSSGATELDFEGSNKYGYITVATDSSGVIQIAALNNTDTYTIKLVGYVS